MFKRKRNKEPETEEQKSLREASEKVGSMISRNNPKPKEIKTYPLPGTLATELWIYALIPLSIFLIFHDNSRYWLQDNASWVVIVTLIVTWLFWFWVSWQYIKIRNRRLSKEHGRDYGVESVIEKRKK